MLAAVHFAAPALLAGAAVAALPFVIHLLLRPRARRVRFPAVAFLRPALASGQRAQRLRNLWLLLIRALLLGCVALLLAGPTCAPTGATPDVERPVACVLVVDDSWSVRYQLDGKTTMLDRARDAALALTRTAADWPQPSALGLVWADPRRAVTELTTDHAVVRSRLREADALGPHATPLNHALSEAARVLQAARQPDRRLVVFTDQAAHAWRDVTPGLLTGIDNLSVRVRSVCPDRRTNIAITTASGPAGLHPESLPVPVDVTLSAAGLGAKCTLVVREQERVVERIGVLEIPADGAHDLTFVLPPTPPGVHAWALELEPDDRLDFDQQRYVVFQTAQRPAAWLLTPAEAGPEEDLTALLLRNLLAPEALDAARQLVTFRHCLPAEFGEVALDELDSPGHGPPDRDADLIVVTGGGELNEAARQRLRRSAERGAVVLLLPGSRGDAADWPGLRRLVVREVPRVETLDSVTSFAWESGSTYAGRGPALDELTRTAVRRRVVLAGLEEGVVVEARYADEVPAIVSLRRGRGRLVLLTTSPDPEWSELGRRAAGLLTWLHELMQEARGSPDAVATFTAGQATRHSFAGSPGRGTARVLSWTDEQARPLALRLSNGEPTRNWPTEQPGIYAVRTGHKDDPDALYAVNWPAEESDLRPVAVDRLEALLGVGEVGLDGAGTLDDEAKPTMLSRLTGLLHADRALPVVLLVLILAELFLANRLRRVAVPK